jgi:precorrin-2 dehydrogenase/sirohydrochlorin ferrochelatase
VSRQIAESARRRNVLVYIVDDPLQSDLIVPAVLRRGKLVVTVSSSGLAPAFASRVRDYLSGILGESFGEVLERLPAVRERLKERYPDPARRRAAWYRYLDERVLPRLKERGDHIRKHRGAREES